MRQEDRNGDAQKHDLAASELDDNSEKQVNQEQRSAVALKRAELQASALQKEQEQAILIRHLARQQAIEQRMKDVALKRVLLLQQHQKEACTSHSCPVFTF